MFFVMEFYDGITNEAGSKYCRFKSVSYFSEMSCGQCCYAQNIFVIIAMRLDARHAQTLARSCTQADSGCTPRCSLPAALVPGADRHGSPPGCQRNPDRLWAVCPTHGLDY